VFGVFWHWFSKQLSFVQGLPSSHSAGLLHVLHVNVDTWKLSMPASVNESFGESVAVNRTRVCALGVM